MARVSLTPPRTLLLRVMEWYSRRTYGKVLDPGKAPDLTSQGFKDSCDLSDTGRGAGAAAATD
ncbi:hypothetical protein [Streptomyces lancefieldiae]|uniref:Uncharacterized protein n=1 Tax=Streptomyces lancefieldiae TaxID=3075520 RepID=A0ABU3AJA6_9ACTN|nr:hypothetical protein [Streptomyces sp. DSM 40712]MDT0608956.1 hypothetical protein [Streptomyces sp. DSM 40712]